jgi:hypothetical protein
MSESHCMHACMHACMHVCMHACNVCKFSRCRNNKRKYTYLHTCIHTCTHAHEFLNAHNKMTVAVQIPGPQLTRATMNPGQVTRATRNRAFTHAHTYALTAAQESGTRTVKPFPGLHVARTDLQSRMPCRAGYRLGGRRAGERRLLGEVVVEGVIVCG